MRIIAGKFKGSLLYLVKDKSIRPLKDLVRESIFNLLNHSKKLSFNLEQSIILDLYAGAGSFGLECLSRQAQSVFFVEKEQNALKLLKRNIEKLKVLNKTKIYSTDVFTAVKKNIFKRKFDLIFCDPPFKNTNVDNLISLIFDANLLNENGIIVLHRNKATNEKFPKYFQILEEKNYGASKILFATF